MLNLILFLNVIASLLMNDLRFANNQTQKIDLQTNEEIKNKKGSGNFDVQDNEHFYNYKNNITLKSDEITLFFANSTDKRTLVEDDHGYAKKLFTLYKQDPFAIYQFRLKTWTWKYPGHCPGWCPVFRDAILLSEPHWNYVPQFYSGKVNFKRESKDDAYVQLSNSSKWYKLVVYADEKTKKPVMGSNVYLTYFFALWRIGNKDFKFNYHTQNDWRQPLSLTFTSFPQANNRIDPRNYYQELAEQIYDTGFAGNDPFAFTQNDQFTKWGISNLRKTLERQNHENEVKYEYVIPTGVIFVETKKGHYQFMTDEILHSLIPSGAKKVTFDLAIDFIVPLKADEKDFDHTWMNNFKILNFVSFAYVTFEIQNRTIVN